MTNKGVIYYATGEKCISEAKISAKSLKETNDVNVTIFCDQENINAPYVDEVVTIEPDPYPFHDRINYLKKTPYKKTIYLDSDTYVVDDISPIFELLDRFDLAASFNESRDTAAEHTKFKTLNIDVPDSFPEYQCGVVGYVNTEKIQHLFDDWQRRYDQHKDKNVIDQPHFREALYNSTVSVGTLPTEYNVLPTFGGYIHNNIKIIHNAGSENDLMNPHEFKEIAQKLNETSPQDRVFLYDFKEELQNIHTTGSKYIIGEVTDIPTIEGRYIIINNTLTGRIAYLMNKGRHSCGEWLRNRR